MAASSGKRPRLPPALSFVELGEPYASFGSSAAERSRYRLEGGVSHHSNGESTLDCERHDAGSRLVRRAFGVDVDVVEPNHASPDEAIEDSARPVPKKDIADLTVDARGLRAITAARLERRRHDDVLRQARMGSTRFRRPKTSCRLQPSLELVRAGARSVGSPGVLGSRTRRRASRAPESIDLTRARDI
jgi:hypothetical protein